MQLAPKITKLLENLEIQQNNVFNKVQFTNDCRKFEIQMYNIYKGKTLHT